MIGYFVDNVDSLKHYVTYGETFTKEKEIVSQNFSADRNTQHCEPPSSKSSLRFSKDSNFYGLFLIFIII